MFRAITKDIAYIAEMPKPQPAEVANLRPQMEFTDLSLSEMLWTCDRAVAVLGHKVQLRRATAYLIGARVLPLSYHEIRLDSSAVDLQQYVGFGTDGLVVAGGWPANGAAPLLPASRSHHPPLGIPIVCLPASINNDLPASELSIGSDTALNSITTDVDKIKQSAVASRRCFVVEVMGRDCGYLALMSGLATGAERTYLPEEGITLEDLTTDVRSLTDGFRAGKRLGLVGFGKIAQAVWGAGPACGFSPKPEDPPPTLPSSGRLQPVTS